MNVLVLGGTIFLGRALVTALTGRGHRVTTFTRGVHPTADAPTATRLFGDREGDLSALPTSGWDAVVDTSGYRPAVVRASAEHLRAAGCYAFVSTISVYDETVPEIREDSPLAPLPAGVTENSPEAYGPLKARCEDVVRDVFDGRAIVARPGLIVGPHDPSDRFTYWPERAARGGTMLAPAPAERFVQFIDVRDVARFLVRAIEMGASGDFNVTGLPQATTMGDVVAASRAAAGVPSEVVWIGDEFLVLHGVGPWMELPLWIPDSAGLPGFANADVTRAIANGLLIRALADTVGDTLAWASTRPLSAVRKAGLSAEREAELLRAWSE
jgi:2'-hydroxyisoflavone reductase